jgi:hypothetical protein
MDGRDASPAVLEVKESSGLSEWPELDIELHNQFELPVLSRNYRRRLSSFFPPNYAILNWKRNLIDITADFSNDHNHQASESEFVSDSPHAQVLGKQ